MAAHDTGIAPARLKAGYNRRVNAITPALDAWIRQVIPSRDASWIAEPLAAEASFRQFFRLRAGQSSWIVMDSPPEKERNAQFCHLAAVFGAARLPVPEVLAADHAAGYYLLSDLGERDLETAYRDGDTDAALGAAIDALVQLQTVRDPQIVAYTPARFTEELEIFKEWFLGDLLDCSLPDAIETIFELLVRRTQEQPQCCVHRDYHCRNLLYSGNGQFGIVDFQDALVGPVAYDLASLLRDCYHEFPESYVARWRQIYLARREQHSGEKYDRERFRQDVDYCAIQRQLKAIGIFARLAGRDGKVSHLPHIAPLLRRLIHLCGDYSELAALGAFLAELPARLPVELQEPGG
jgi:aminoglycoside/choline kinase family phosphotransferase